jgi:hypothetical protein
MRIFVVVAKNRPDLYEYFTSGFAGIDNVEVIIDRRIGPEQPASTVGSQYSERRNAQNIYEQLEQRGFVIVRIPAE